MNTQFDDETLDLKMAICKTYWSRQNKWQKKKLLKKLIMMKLICETK